MKLKDYLKKHNMTTVQLGKIVGCHQTMASKIALGDRMPSARLALRIERATGGVVTRDELLFPELYDEDATPIVKPAKRKTTKR